MAGHGRVCVGRCWPAGRWGTEAPVPAALPRGAGMGALGRSQPGARGDAGAAAGVAWRGVSPACSPAPCRRGALRELTPAETPHGTLSWPWDVGSCVPARPQRGNPPSTAADALCQHLFGFYRGCGGWRSPSVPATAGWERVSDGHGHGSRRSPSWGVQGPASWGHWGPSSCCAQGPEPQGGRDPRLGVRRQEVLLLRRWAWREGSAIAAPTLPAQGYQTRGRTFLGR